MFHAGSISLLIGENVNHLFPSVLCFVHTLLLACQTAGHSTTSSTHRVDAAGDSLHDENQACVSGLSSLLSIVVFYRYPTFRPSP